MKYIKVFAAAAFAFGAGMFGYHTGLIAELGGVSLPIGKALVFAVVQGLVFGATITAMVVAFDRSRVAAGIDVTQDALRPVDATLIPSTGSQATARVRTALDGLHAVRWRVERPDRLEVRTGVTVKSFGEVVRADLKPSDGGTLVTVSSRSWIPATVVDYGRNSDNVREVIEALERSS